MTHRMVLINSWIFVTAPTNTALKFVYTANKLMKTCYVVFYMAQYYFTTQVSFIKTKA